MTRSDLVARLAERFSQLTQRDTEFAVKTILDAMTDALARGHRIEIRGFGSFSINRRPPRVGRNPRSGEQVVIPEKLVPHFKPGKALREVGRRPDAGATTRPPTRGPGAARDTALESARMRVFVWLFRAFIFFTLFAFALNNQQSATVRWFFGVEWHTPMVIVVLVAFAAGCAHRRAGDGAGLVEAPREALRRRPAADRPAPRSRPPARHRRSSAPSTRRAKASRPASWTSTSSGC